MSTIAKFLPKPPDQFSTQIASSTVATDALTVTLDSTSGLPTEGVGQFFKKDSNGNLVSGSVEFVHWTNVSGSTITFSDTDDRGITGSDAGAQAYVADDYFEVWASTYYVGGYGGVVEHNSDGTHDDTIITTLTGTQTLTNKTLTSPVLTTPVLSDGTTMTTNGGIIYDRTNKKILVGDGTNTQAIQTGAWAAYTPTVSGAVSDIGNATLSCSYAQLGKLVMVRMLITFGSGTSFTAGNMTISLPVTSFNANGGIMGKCFLNDAGTALYSGSFGYSNTTTLIVYVEKSDATYGTLTAVTNSVPFTWTTSDYINGTFVYQAA